MSKGDRKQLKPEYREQGASLEAFLIGFVALFVFVAMYALLMRRSLSSAQENLLLRPAAVQDFGHGFTDAATNEPIDAQIIMLDRVDKLTIEKQIPAAQTTGLRLTFLTEGTNVEAFADGAKIYDTGLSDAEKMGREPGRITNMIDLPDAAGGTPLKLTFTPYKRHATVNLGSMCIGTEASLLFRALSMNIPVAFGCTFAICLGLILLGYGLYFHIKKTRYSTEILLIAIFAMLAALWACMDSTLFQLFTDKLAIRYQLRYYLLAVLFIPIVFLFKNRCKGSTRPFAIINSGFAIVLILNTSLYAMNVLPLSDSVYLVYALWVALWIISLIKMIDEKKHHQNSALIYPFLAYTYLMLAALSDFVLYEWRLTDRDSLLFKIVLLLFLLVFSVSRFRANFTNLRNNDFVEYYRDLAFTDPVTEGYSTNWFAEKSAAYLKDQKNYAVVYFDLLHFKMVNDTIGRKGGDAALKEMYAAVSRHMKNREVMCHAGDAHFLLLLNETEQEIITKRLMAMKQAINAVPLSGMEQNNVGVIAGVYRVGEEELSVARMIDRAIIARNEMQIEVINGFGCAFFTEAILDKLRREDALKNRMLDGMKAGEFMIYLQPKVDPKTGNVRGAEALARWMDPIEGMISPSEFIPIFENNGSIISMNLFMLRGTVAIINDWIRAGITPVTVSVNLSRVSIHNPLFMDAFTYIMKDEDTPVSYLEFEFTENVVYESAEQMNELVEMIHGFGSTCSIDDFGCSYSNLTMLKDIPVDVLKLDQDFLKQHAALNVTGRSLTIVDAIISMAHELRMEVVVEGVENKEQADFLKDCGCDMIQGYYYARPLPVAEFEAYLKSRNPEVN